MDSLLERIPGESKRAYAAFIEYVTMGQARSLRRLLEDFKKRPSPPTGLWVTISKWSGDNHWVERVTKYDAAMREKAIADFEAHWKQKVMGSTETLGRLSEQGRVSIADFVTARLVRAANIISLEEDADEDAGEFVQVIELNWDAIKEKGHLVKSITNTKYGPRIELHDGQSALIQMGRHHKLFVDQSEVTSLTVQVSADDMAVARAKAKDYEKGLLDDRPNE